MSLPTIQNVLFLYYSCLPALLMVFLSRSLSLALVVIIWYLVLPFTFVRAYLTFPKAIVIILKHATSLCFSMLPGPALVQADLDYQMADVNQKIQQYVAASQGHSAELDRAFIMAIEIGSFIYLFCLFKSYNAFISKFRCDKCVYIRGIGWLKWFLELAFSHMTPLCWCKGSIGQFVPV